MAFFLVLHNDNVLLDAAFDVMTAGQ